MKRRHSAHLKDKSEQSILVAFRRKFVVTNLVFVALVLAVATVAVGVFTFQKSEGAVYDSLQHRVTANESLRSSGAVGKAILQSERSYLENSDESSGPVQRDADGDMMVATSSYFVDRSGTYETYEDLLGLDSSTLSSALSSVYTLANASGGLSVQGKLSSLNLYFVAMPTDDGVDIAFASAGFVERSVLSVVGALGGAWPSFSWRAWSSRSGPWPRSSAPGAVSGSSSPARATS